MARESAGIEIFGRGAKTIDVSSKAQVPRTPALGAGAVLLAVLATAAFAAAVIERSRHSDFVDLFVWIAMGASAVAVLLGAFALLSGRGRLAGFVAVVLGLASNPWVLSRVLEYAAGLPA